MPCPVLRCLFRYSIYAISRSPSVQAFQDHIPGSLTHIAGGVFHFLLGFNEIHNMIIAEGVRETMPNTPSFRELHAHSVAVSNIAYSISNRIKIGKPSELATIGLLHDVGQIVIELLKGRNPKMAVFIASLDKSQMGSLLLETWSLPEVLWRTVEFMPYPEFSSPDNIPEEFRNNVILLYLAHLSYDFFLGRPENTLPTSFFDENKRLIGLKDYSLYEIAQRCALPGLLKKITSLPAPLRKLIQEHIQRTTVQRSRLFKRGCTSRNIRPLPFRKAVAQILSPTLAFWYASRWQIHKR